MTPIGKIWCIKIDFPKSYDQITIFRENRIYGHIGKNTPYI